MSFEISVARKHHGHLSNHINGMPHVAHHTAEQPGQITDPSGLVLHYVPVEGKDSIHFEVVSNPNNVSEADIKTKIQADVNHLLTLPGRA